MNNTTSTVDVKFVLEKSTNSNNTFSVVYDGIISSDQLNFTQELKMQDWVGWRWRIYSEVNGLNLIILIILKAVGMLQELNMITVCTKKDGLRESMITHTYVKSQVLVLNKAMIGKVYNV